MVTGAFGPVTTARGVSGANMTVPAAEQREFAFVYGQRGTRSMRLLRRSPTELRSGVDLPGRSISSRL
jgi:hypothetical protein